MRRMISHSKAHNSEFRIPNSEFRILTWRKQRLPLAIFILLCVNLAIAPAVYAAADGSLERRHAWALGILGLVTLGLLVYLFDVVFRPERY